jgi:guanylate kinase
VGKGTIVRSLLARYPDLSLSVSVTTRAPRPGEREGVDYFFVSDDRFDELVEQGELLEWAEIYGHRSGTPRAPIRDLLAAGRDVLLEIDVQGADWVRKRAPDAVLVFLRPPSLEELERRLRSRGTETEEKLARRLAKAGAEMADSSWFDHVVVNDEVARAAERVGAILDASPPPDADSADPKDVDE